jgi:hypothetical protein
MEDIDLSGAATMHGPVSVVYQAPTAVTLSSVQADGGQTGSATLALLAGSAGRSGRGGGLSAAQHGCLANRSQPAGVAAPLPPAGDEDPSYCERASAARLRPFLLRLVGNAGQECKQIVRYSARKVVYNQ